MDRKIQKWSHKCMKEAVHAWFAVQPKTFFYEGIKKLVQRWKKCIEKQVDYVEKWCYYKFSIFIEINFVSVARIIIDSLTYLGFARETVKIFFFTSNVSADNTMA